MAIMSPIKIIRGLVICFIFCFLSLSEAASVSSELPSVTVAKKESLSSLSKSLSKINLPQVPVPEFPKFVSRPGKNPSQSQNQNSVQSSNQHNNNSNQHHHQQPQQQQQHSQSQTPQQQPTVHNSYSQNQHIHNLNLPSPTSILQDNDEEFNNEFQDEMMLTETDPELHDGFTPSENFSASPDRVQQHHQQQDSSPMPALNLPPLPNTDTLSHPVPPVVSLTGTKPASSSTSSSSSSNGGKNEPIKSGTQPNGEKFQETSGDFPMPLHVMTILNALGSGGSLAQASKPEKDSAGHGFTTANAIGYATGDNATVTASVSNKMEVNTQTVVLTESATASASSLSNGTAFSQATLSSNGWASQLGQGNGWPTGPGWAKASPVKKGKKLISFLHPPVV